MRTTDPDPKPLGPILGEKVQSPAQPKPSDAHVAPNIVRGADGRLRTDLPLPK
jgi:hypothetical protein